MRQTTPFPWHVGYSSNGELGIFSFAEPQTGYIPDKGRVIVCLIAPANNTTQEDLNNAYLIVETMNKLNENHL